MKLFATTLFIADLARTKEFYSKAFEKSPVYEDANSVVFQFGESLINLLVETEATGLISPAKVATQESGSRAQMTVQVEDVDAHVARLHSLGIDLMNGPMDRPWGIRTALISDPDGHLWEFAH